MPDRPAHRRRAALAAGALALAALLTACGAGAEEGSPSLAGAVHAPYDVPATTLVDTEGRPWSLEEDADADLTLVFFGYTRCPDVCPAVMSTVASALTRLDEADRRRVEVVFVTTDPARDTGPVLRDYLDRFAPEGSFTGLTGDLEDVVAAGEPLAVFVSDGQRLPSGGYDLNSHSTQVSGVLPDGTSPILWTQDVSAAQLAADITGLLGPDRDAMLEQGLSS